MKAFGKALGCLWLCIGLIAVAEFIARRLGASPGSGGGLMCITLLIAAAMANPI